MSERVKFILIQKIKPLVFLYEFIDRLDACMRASIQPAFGSLSTQVKTKLCPSPAQHDSLFRKFLIFACY